MVLVQFVGEFGYWMANGRPPWASYRALMSGRLIGIYKCPDFWPVVVVETWRCMLEKCMLAVMGAEAKEAYETEQRCRGLEAGIEGRIHMVQLLWKQHDQEEDWSFSSLTRAMPSMRRTAHPCCGWYATSGPVARGINLG